MVEINLTPVQHLCVHPFIAYNASVHTTKHISQIVALIAPGVK